MPKLDPPSHAVIAWADSSAVYVELPGSPGHTLRFALSDSGLSKALNLMRQIHRQANGPKPKNYLPPLHGLTEGQRDGAKAVLRRLNMG